MVYIHGIHTIYGSSHRITRETASAKIEKLYVSMEFVHASDLTHTDISGDFAACGQGHKHQTF